MQAAGLQGRSLHAILVAKLTLSVPSAVRKNRYVILPVDFEEAWKVSCLELFALSHVILIKTQLFLASQQTVKRLDETHEFCEFRVFGIFVSYHGYPLQIGSLAFTGPLVFFPCVVHKLTRFLLVAFFYHVSLPIQHIFTSHL